jgi:hypothetical protein
MNKLKYLTKFKSRRGKFDFYRKDSDLKRLRRSENALVGLMIFFTINTPNIVEMIFEGGWKTLIGLFVFSFTVYTYISYYRINQIIELFIEEAPQSVDPIIENLQDDESDPVVVRQ